MKCEKCGNIIEEKYIWCPVCGTRKPKIEKNDNNNKKDIVKKIKSSDNMNKKATISNQIISSVICNNCNSIVNENDRFCSSCGSKITNIQIVNNNMENQKISTWYLILI